LLWIFIPIFSGLPWIPTHRPRIHKALQLAQLQPGELMVDLGAGDGRVLILAARKFGASALGIELSPTHCLIAWARARFQGVSDRVSIHMGDFYKHDLGKADVVYAYVTSNHAPRLRTYLEDQLSPGSRVVTISADLDGWEPSAFDSEELIFLYHMPPAPGSLSTYLAKRGSD
jgi:SAM-dependent methyltransferase